MLKVGDKVKVFYNSNGSGIVKQAMNKIGIVKSVHNPDSSECPGMVYVEFGEIIFSTVSCVGFFKGEIEKVSTKGQQLLFSFME